MRTYQFKTLKELGDIAGKSVIVRGSFNVPIKDGHISDTARIDTTLKTIQYLLDKDAKVVLMGHIGREREDTLEPVLRYLQNHMPVIFVRDIFGNEAQQAMKYATPGSVVLFENLRRWDGEVENDETFAQHLAQFGDIYVNEAFPVSHREHASVVALPKSLPSYAGLQFEKEVQTLSSLFDPEHPFLFILGGAKVHTKLPLIRGFTKKADTLFIGGALANDFYKTKGFEIGKSVASDQMVPQDILEATHILLPGDVVVERGGKKENIPISDVEKDDAIYDAGQESVTRLIRQINKAKCILWNGPLGLCEKGYVDGTNAIAHAIAHSNARSIIGGGDTLASVDNALESRFSFVSTGGGAMLDFLADGTLPGIDALEASK